MVVANVNYNLVVINFNNNALQITKRKTMDINKWKSLAVAINSWKDLWAMKNLADYKN